MGFLFLLDFPLYKIKINKKYVATPKKNRSSLGMDFQKLKNQPTFSFHLKASRVGPWIG